MTKFSRSQHRFPSFNLIGSRQRKFAACCLWLLTKGQSSEITVIYYEVFQAFMFIYISCTNYIWSERLYEG